LKVSRLTVTPVDLTQAAALAGALAGALAAVLGAAVAAGVETAVEALGLDELHADTTRASPVSSAAQRINRRLRIESSSSH
jgi:sugar (pentulose or hexulose) kinase